MMSNRHNQTAKAVYSQTTATCCKAEYCSDEGEFQHTYFVNKDTQLICTAMKILIP